MILWNASRQLYHLDSLHSADIKVLMFVIHRLRHRVEEWLRSQSELAFRWIEQIPDEKHACVSFVLRRLIWLASHHSLVP